MRRRSRRRSPPGRFGVAGVDGRRARDLVPMRLRSVAAGPDAAAPAAALREEWRPVPPAGTGRCPPNAGRPPNAFPRCRAAWMPLKQRRGPRGPAPPGACVSNCGSDGILAAAPRAPASGSRRGRAARFDRVGDAVEASGRRAKHAGHRQMPAKRVSGHFSARLLPVWRRQSRFGTKSLRKKFRDARATD